MEAAAAAAAGGGGCVGGNAGGGGGPGPGSMPGKRRRRWGGLRQQWKLLGLFEIDRQHEFFSLTCMMKEGLAAAVENTVHRAPTTEVSDDDFRAEDTHIHKDFTMQTFAGPVFSSLRGSVGLTEQEYQQSLCSENCYLQFISNSKSKADFFLTNDKRFFLKTQNKREVRFLLDNLKIYMEHLRKYPHSLLVRFLGVHRIIIPHRLKKYFIVMQSVFYPDERIDARYDIKGCEVSRWTEPAPEGKRVIVVLKDLNFEGQYIELEEFDQHLSGQDAERPRTLNQQHSWLQRQVEIDTHFLRRLNVLDYSLLLAHQPLHRDERLQNLSFASVIVRTKKSVNPGSSPVLTDIAAVPGEVPEDDSISLMSKSDGRSLKKPRAGENVEGSEATEVPDFKAQNRRLLPNFKNPLHVIDGPEQRYFIGIVDIFTVYGFKKRLEHLWKRLRHPGRSFSTVSPQSYCARLCQWVRDHTK